MHDVLLFGLGSIGGVYAFLLQNSGECRLSVIARSNYKAVKENGLEVKTLEHGNQVVKPHNTFNSPKDAEGKYDFVVCANKALDPNRLPSDLAPVISPGHTTIVIIQNGVGAEEPFREMYPDNPIVTCVSWTGAGQEGPGVVIQTNADFLTMGTFPEDAETTSIQTFASILDKGKAHYEIVPDILKKRWEKVVWNAAWNSITAMTSYDVHAILESSPEAEPVLRRLMDEVIQVARAQGIELSLSLTDELFQNAKSRKTTFISSTMMDVEAKKQTEVEVILGHAVRMGQRYKVDTPTLSLAYVAVKAIDNKLSKL